MTGRTRLRPSAGTAIVAALVLLGTSLALAGAAPGRTAGTSVLTLGPMSSRASLRFDVDLRIRNAAVRRFLQRSSDPRDPLYGRALSPAQFGARFGISRAGEQAVTDWIRGAGLRVTGAYPQRTSIEVEGSVGRIEAMLGTRIGLFRDLDGSVYHASLGAPSLPATIRPWVSGISGLSDRAKPVPQDIPAQGMAPQDVAGAYDIGPLWNQGIHGEGETVGLVSLEAFQDSDPAAFANYYHVSGPAPQHVAVDGGLTPSADAGEVNLDVDTVRAVAPGAQVLDYEVPTSDNSNGSFATAIAHAVNQIVQEGRAKIVSISYGVCDVPTIGGQPWFPHSEQLAAETALAAAAAAHISIFVSSGDGAAYGCQHFVPQDVRVTASWPGDSPSVISVGGTFLAVRNDGSYLQEFPWANPITRWGGGGGLNPYAARPSWQQGPGVESRFSNGKRQFPDVSGDADSNTGYRVVYDGKLHRVGGTSGSSPFWAGTLALLQEYVTKHGGGPLGFVAPELYRLAGSTQPFPPFHDITAGDNLFYPATPGWDFATGLGSPDVYNLARDLAGGR